VLFEQGETVLEHFSLVGGDSFRGQRLFFISHRRIEIASFCAGSSKRVEPMFVPKQELAGRCGVFDCLLAIPKCKDPDTSTEATPGH
jgi:hypothetical protein